MLGVYICRSLLASGAEVRGVVRNPDKARFLEQEGVRFVRADLMDRNALTEAFEGCDAVVSNAALYSVKNFRWNDNYIANKVGTENVYEAAAAAGVKRMIHISTFGVYRWKLGKPPINDESKTIDGSRKQGGAYRATKQMGERLAFEISRSHDMMTTAVRPAGIYGARDSNLVPYFKFLMRLPFCFFPKFSFPLVYAGDIADAVVGALKNDASAEKAYITAGRNETIYDFARAWKQAYGKGAFLIPIPTGTGVYVDCSKAQSELGFKNRPYVEGLRLTFEEDRRHRKGANSKKAARNTNG